MGQLRDHRAAAPGGPDDHRAALRGRRLRHPEPSPHLHLSPGRWVRRRARCPGRRRGRARVRRVDRPPAGHRGVPASGHRRRPDRADDVLRRGRGRGRLRDRRAHGAPVHSGESVVPLPAGADAGGGPGRPAVPDLRRGSGVAALLLPLGRRARRRATHRGRRGEALRRRRARGAGAADARRPSCRGALHPLRVAVAAPAGRAEDPAGAVPVSGLQRSARRGHDPRDAALLRSPGARGPELLRAVRGRLDHREPAACGALRHPGGDRRGVPGDPVSGRAAARGAGARKRAAAHLDVEPDVAGAAGQMGDAGPDGFAPPAATAERTGLRGDGWLRPRAGG